MKTVKVICENGATWNTSVSDKSTEESKNAYFVGQMFNTASYPDEVMSKCISAEYIPDYSKLQLHGEPVNDFKPERSCCANDIILVSQGTQCTNCGRIL